MAQVAARRPWLWGATLGAIPWDRKRSPRARRSSPLAALAGATDDARRLGGGPQKPTRLAVDGLPADLYPPHTNRRFDLMPNSPAEAA